MHKKVGSQDPTTGIMVWRLGHHAYKTPMFYTKERFFRRIQSIFCQDGDRTMKVFVKGLDTDWSIEHDKVDHERLKNAAKIDTHENLTIESQEYMWRSFKQGKWCQHKPVIQEQSV